LVKERQMPDKSADEVKEEIEYQSIADFLKSAPPNQLINISDLAEVGKYPNSPYFYKMRTLEIQMQCDHEQCNGTRFFRCVAGSGTALETKDYEFFYITYRCSNCQRVDKTFSLAAKVKKTGKPQGECYKFGELPPYGPPVSPKLIKLIGPDRDEFLKGRRCENQGLGVGAFIYYRRVVENQKIEYLAKLSKSQKKLVFPPIKSRS